MRPTILDLTLASAQAAMKIDEWRVLEHVIVSDHRLIIFNYAVKEMERKEENSKRLNVREADWDAFRQRLAEGLFNG